jgi:hypothetical protein
MSKTRKLPDPIIPKRGVVAPSGDITIGETTYKFPVLDGGLGQVLTTTGRGELVWQSPSASTATLTPKDIFTDYTISVEDNFIRYRGDAPGTITLPKCSTLGGMQLIIQNCSVAPCTIIQHDGDTFDGDYDPLVLDDKPQSASLVCDGLDTWLLV